MFGSATNTLALIGACAIVFWIICWLILASKSDFFPHFVQSASAALAAILAFCSAIPSALLALPIWLNYRKTMDQIRREEHDKTKDLYEKLHAKDYQKGYDKGWTASQSFYKNVYPSLKDDSRKLMYDYDILLKDYCYLHKLCSSSKEFRDKLEDLSTPEFLTFGGTACTSAATRTARGSTSPLQP